MFFLNLKNLIGECVVNKNNNGHMICIVGAVEGKV